MPVITRRVSYKIRNNRLHIRIRWDKTSDLSISTGIAVNASKWDGRRCLPGSRHGHDQRPAGAINRQIQIIEDNLEEAFLEAEKAGYVPSKQQIRAVILPDEARQPDFFPVFNRFVIQVSVEKAWSDNTVKTVRQLIPVLEAFKPDISFSDINRDTLSAFITFMQHNRVKGRFVPGNIKAGERDSHPAYSNTVVMKYARILKWFLRWAAHHEYIPRDIVDEWKPTVKTIPKPVVFLTPGELSILEKAELPAGSELDRARDLLVFCSFTSLRYSDAMALRKTDVFPSHIDVVTIKTDTPVRIELNTHSRRILDKWKDFDGPKALPQLPLNRANKVIKDLAQRLGIDSPVAVSQYYGTKRVDKVCPKYELLSTHTGRRSFICNALAMGIPPHVVIEWTGHANIQAMQPYIAVALSTRASAMSLFNDPENE